ncbi:hypothetical protein, partial [Paludisphaera soli]|uniref:hypothetical protein n=1 Tax=Paludisphaera soli TaxID=2712865 RepID=UPI00197E4528
MSDPRRQKIELELELEQARNFLGGAGSPHVSVEPGSDPPDVVVHREGSPPIAVEVTEYHRGK